MLSVLTCGTLGGGPHLIDVRSCREAAAAVPPPVFLANECEGSAPGTAMTLPRASDATESNCVIGFIFKGSDGEMYATMAGSCYLDIPRAKAVSFGVRRGPLVTGSDGRFVAEVAFALNDGAVDFGLIRLFRGITILPQMCHFGGPTGMEKGTTGSPMVGHAVDIGLAGPIVLPHGLSDAHRISGGGVNSVGAIVTTDSGGIVGTVVNTFDPTTAFNVIERPARGLAAAERTLRIRLTLQTAPLID